MYIQFKSHILAATGDDDWTISGIAVPYNVATTDRYYKISFAKGSFDKVLSTIDLSQTIVPILHSHDQSDLPLGRVTKLYASDQGLMFTAVLTKGIADKHRIALQAGTLQGVSVGVIFSAEPDDDNNMVVDEVSDIFEISLVNFPALKGAKVKEAVLAQEPQKDVERLVETLQAHESLRNIERLLRKLGGISAKEAKAIVAGLKKPRE